MTDLAGALQVALFNALSAIDGMPPVVSEAPIDADDKPVFPFVLLGDHQITEVGGKGSRLEEHDVAIHFCDQETTKLAARAKMELIRGGLHEQPLTAAGAKLSDPTFISANLMLMDDGSTYVGSQNFKVFAQPAS